VFFREEELARPWGLMVRDVTIWYQTLVSTLSLDGSDKWYLDQGFEKKLCLED
jgi:hypothetical protein